MGYAGYYSTTNKIPDKLSDLDVAIRIIPSMDTLEIIGKLVRNVVVQPNDEKYRKIKLSNAKIKAVIADVDGGVETLLAMGWTVAEDDAECLVVAKGKLTMKEVRAVEDAKDRLKKEMRSASVSRSASNRSLKENDINAERLREQLEADKRERAAMGPVTAGSKAQALPSAGSNITTAKDAGCQGNAGCC